VTLRTLCFSKSKSTYVSWMRLKLRNMPLLSRSTKRAYRSDENYTSSIVCSCHCHFTNVQTSHDSMSTAKPSKRKRAKKLHRLDQTTHSLVQHDSIASGGFDSNSDATASLTPSETEPTIGRCMRGNSNIDNVLDYDLGAEMGYGSPSNSWSEVSAIGNHFSATTATALTAVEDEDDLYWFNCLFDPIGGFLVGPEAYNDALLQNFEPNVSTSFASYEPPTVWSGNSFTPELRTDEPSLWATATAAPSSWNCRNDNSGPHVSSELSHSEPVLSEVSFNDLIPGCYTQLQMTLRIILT
jgi:hypothetical protein